MIRINLLEIREEKRRVELRNLVVLAVLVWGVVIASVVIVHQQLRSKINTVNLDIQREEEELNQLKTLVGQVEQIKQQKQELEKKLSIIESLETNRGQVVDLLLAIAQLMAEEVWAKKIEIKDNSVAMEATAIDMQSIGLFVKALKSDPRFSNPQTANIKATTGKDKASGFVEFKLTVTYVGTPKPVNVSAAQALTDTTSKQGKQ